MINKNKIHSSKEYNTWFNSKYYHILYKDRDNKEAKKFISKLTEKLNLKKNAKILDAACGKGRHAIEIEKLGYNVTGIDLSENSINYAKSYENNNLKFLIHDISVPLRHKFDAVFNLFTSFGYYNREKDLQILLAIEKNLSKNGVGVIDFFNICDVKKNLVKKESTTKEEILFNITRKIKNNIVEKNISIEDKSKKYFYKETVNSLGLEDFKKYFKKTKMEITDVFGDYQLNNFVKNKSPRLIIIFKKKSQPN